MSGDGDDAATAGTEPLDRVVVLNPESGDADHRERVRELADSYGYTVLETQAEGEGLAFGRIAGAAGADLLLAAGGDGTLNEAVRGLDAADALEETTFGVVPTGTGNNFAQNVGVEDAPHAFEVAEHGERRRIDLGTGNDRIFLNSCIAGVTADASASASAEMKARFGMLAYVISGLRTAREFDGLPLGVEATGSESDRTWGGEAVAVLVGNARRFPDEGRTQADVEDGLLDVTIVEQVPTVELLEEAAIKRLFGDETDNVTRLLAAELDVTVRRDSPVSFSFDGEIRDYESLALRTRPKALELCVGDAYEPDPDAGSSR
ncbi:diacylglycerol/lipid kinase family protein [Halorussus marinus]|uniref:diacylglycerol/lipid kinase family protein n=1 Tax=Halorussus marinus TaxID=2505976 RepID=UPI001092170A|nr:YegS/Rv2252/BmrU family lipid kinase [Halorussus marinus]